MNLHREKTARGKMLLHGLGAGGIQKADIERRAREIAIINGRSANTITEDDRATARAELGGEALPATTEEDVQGIGLLTRDPSEPVADTGHQVPNHEDLDEKEAIERLATEGVEEAQHDQMLAARREQRRQDKP